MKSEIMLGTGIEWWTQHYLCPQGMQHPGQDAQEIGPLQFRTVKGYSMEEGRGEHKEGKHLTQS